MHLAYQMDASVSTISPTITYAIDVLVIRMPPFMILPERKELRITMPMQFKKHFETKYAVIIDWFEMWTHRRKYTFLNEPLPILMTKDADNTPSTEQITHICCAL
ncbi:hypothetical protein MAR_002598, partial [Mya arenaria]